MARGSCSRGRVQPSPQALAQPSPQVLAQPELPAGGSLAARSISQLAGQATGGEEVLLVAGIKHIYRNLHLGTPNLMVQVAGCSLTESWCLVQPTGQMAGGGERLSATTRTAAGGAGRLDAGRGG